MRNRKLLEHALRNPAGLRFEEVKKLAQAFGFRLDRVNGSHHIFVRAGVPRLVNLQNCGGKAKAYQVRQLLKLAELHNLPLED
ncbi:MAG TPA: type II toxin-antitoxin system HicA family toxin [Verrucomicrobiae bacterium]|nr:type II toxin-antitoxin system HicA family toxin [Verrucomicrobiae bacterium]